MSVLAKRVLPAVGIYFFALSFAAILQIASSHYELGGISWPFVGYAALNLLRGVGFYTRERWTLYLFGLHAVAYTLVNIGSMIAGTAPGPLLMIVNISVSWGLWLLLYKARHDLVDTKYSRIEAVVFLSIWCLMFYYTLTQTFPLYL